jgi:hypothetical protein
MIISVTLFDRSVRKFSNTRIAGSASKREEW